MEFILYSAVIFLLGIAYSCILVVVGSILERIRRPERSKADEGLVFCKLGSNYVWLTPQEFERLRMTERSE